MSQMPDPVFAVGSELPPLHLPAVSRSTLALYAGASGDHNPIHIDSDFAKAAGMDDVLAHGMLSMAYLGRLLSQWQPQARIRSFNTRFVSITRVNDEITCRGTVTDLLLIDGKNCVKLALSARKADGTATLLGEAIVEVAEPKR